MLFSNPVNTFLRQGRDTNTYSIMDNAADQRGRHNIQFGFSAQRIRVRTDDYAGTSRTYDIGMGTGNWALQTRDLPGICNTDLGPANALLASLAGYITDH